MAKQLRVGHGPLDEDVAKSLTDDEKAWLRSWNRHSEIPGEDEPRAESDGDGGGDGDGAGYDDLTVAELRDELDRRGLPKGGNKDELVARLEEDDEDDES